MNFDLVDVVLLALFVGACALWWSAHAVKERALVATRNHCRAMGVQLLDDSVVLRGFWLKRDRGGQMRWRRHYEFEFTSTGDERYHGSTIMFGQRIETIQLATHRVN